VTVCLLLAAALNALAVAWLIAPGSPDPVAAVRDAFATLRAAPPFQITWSAVPVVAPLVVLLIALLFRPHGARARRPEPATAADDAEQLISPSDRGVGVASGGVGAREPSRSPVARKAVRGGDVGAAPPSPAVGLRLLATLQEEARLIDFLREDIDAYSDEQVGAAVRAIHAALRKAIDDRLTLEPILAGQDGDPVEVPAGVEPELIRLTGNPTGAPPYRGILRHGGWRARDVRLPVPTAGSDPSIIVPAEVEIE